MWQLIHAELRYNALIIAALYGWLAFLFAVMTTDRMAYLLAVVMPVVATALVLVRSGRQKWERRALLLPLRPVKVFRARLFSLLIVVAGAATIVGLLMLRGAYSGQHQVLLWRMISLFNVVAMYLIGAYSLGDVKRESRGGWIRFIYPYAVMLIWLILYRLFLDMDVSTGLDGGLLPGTMFFIKHLLFETPLGTASLAAVNLLLCGIDWLLFNRRTVLTGGKC